jgi:hypothetical protein
MTNFISLSLFVTNMASGPVPAVKIGYYSATPYAIMASRDCKSWQLSGVNNERGATQRHNHYQPD